MPSLVDLLRRASLSLLPLLLSPLTAHAQPAASATDPLAAGGCFERAEIGAFIDKHEGRVLFNFEGNLLFNGYAEDTRFTFVRYRLEQGYRTALLVRDRALDPKNPNDKSKVCLVFAGDDRGTMANPREGLDGASWWYQEYREEDAIARCKQIRPAIYSIWSAQLDDFGGKRMTRAQIQLMGDFYTEGSAEGAKRKQREFVERLSQLEGDSWCASPAYLKNKAISDDRKLVALLTGKRYEFQKKEVADPAALLAIYLPRKAGPKSLGWSMYLVQPSGASFRLATGHVFTPCEDCFAAPK